jgi:lipid-A-disaccharide synthase
VLISCGEPSGDLYAGALVRELRALEPDVGVTGFGGAHLAAAGARLIGDYHGLAVTGLVEVVKVLPRVWAMYRRLLAAAEREPPDVFVAIDFPDFNFRLGRALKQRGIPVVYYIAPQLWAWRPGRLKTMRRFVDRVLVIFPFETGVYAGAGVPVEFVGHPLVDLLESPPPRDAFLRACDLDPARRTVALLPGSRANEVRQLLRLQLAAAERLTAQLAGTQFVVARAPGLDDEAFACVAESRAQGVSVAVVLGATDAAIASADAVVTASGTATIQTALHDRPMVIVYRLSPWTYRLGVRFVHVDTYGMVNLVGGRRIVSELIQDACTPEAIAAETLRLLTDAAQVATMRSGLAEVRARLGGRGASRRAAAAVLQVAQARAGARGGPGGHP